VSSSNRLGLAKCLNGCHKRLVRVAQQTGSIIASGVCISHFHPFVLSSLHVAADFSGYLRLIWCLIGGRNHDSVLDAPVV
jgi:hypothetical protein